MLLSKTFVSLSFITFYAVDAIRMSHHVPRDQGKHTLSFETKMNLDSIGRQTIASTDRKRVSVMTGKHGDISISAANAIICYTVSIAVGIPPTNYTVMLDTGSSLTWVGANETKPYIRSNTSIDTGQNFSVPYGGGVYRTYGEAYFDTLTLSTDLVAEKQLIGAVNNHTGANFQVFDGILGVGPTDLTEQLVHNAAGFPTVMNTLYAQGTIPEEALGVYFVPAPERRSTGVVTFGGVDETAILEPIKYAPLTKRHPTSRYWGVDHSVSYGQETILSNGAGIVDTGTSIILLETEAFKKYQKATGGVMDNSTGFLSISADQYANLKPLTFHIGHGCYELSPNGQIWPRSLNTAIGGNTSTIYLVVSELARANFSSVIGYPFLERFYSVYDTQNKRVGLAKTAYTNANIN